MTYRPNPGDRVIAVDIPGVPELNGKPATVLSEFGDTLSWETPSRYDVRTDDGFLFFGVTVRPLTPEDQS